MNRCQTDSLGMKIKSSRVRKSLKKERRFRQTLSSSLNKNKKHKSQFAQSNSGIGNISSTSEVRSHSSSSEHKAVLENLSQEENKAESINKSELNPKH